MLNGVNLINSFIAHIILLQQNFMGRKVTFVGLELLLLIWNVPGSNPVPAEVFSSFPQHANTG